MLPPVGDLLAITRLFVSPYGKERKNNQEKMWLAILLLGAPKFETLLVFFVDKHIV